MSRSSPTAPWAVGPVRVRRVRGPHPDDPDQHYWRAEIRDDDGPRQVWTGWGRRLDPELSARILSAATAAAAEIEAESAPADPTVRYLLGCWRAEQESRAESGEIRPNSLKIYRAAIRFLAVGLGDLLCDRLDADALRAYVRARTAGSIRPPPSPGTEGRRRARSWAASSQSIATELSALHAAWAWGFRRGLVAERDLDLPRVAVRPTRSRYTPTVEEVARVIAALPDDWRRVAARLYAATGARLSEIGELRWRAVDRERQEIRIDGKTGPRVVPIDAGILRVLGTPGPPDALVLGRSSSTVASFSTQLRRACAKAGCEPWTTHALRRLACDRLYEAGADVGVVAKFLGQSPQVALRYYRVPRPSVLRGAALRAGLALPELDEAAVIDLDARRRG